MEREYSIEIESFNSAGIQNIATIIDATHMRCIGKGYSCGHDGEADYVIGFYAIPDKRHGGEIRVANTNGDPIWEDEDPAAFHALASECGVDFD
jgi:hypothetical protein